MILLKICLFSAIMIAGYQHQDGKKIEIVGKALNAKAGAVVVSADQVTYYVDGLESWDKKVYGKKIKVSGILVIENLPKDDHQELPAAEIKGVKRTIKKPKWETVN